MLTKFDLRKYKYIKSEVLQLREQITEITALMIAPKSPRLTGEPGGGSGDHDKIGNILAKIDQLTFLYYKKLGELADLQVMIESEIANLEPEEKILVRTYYFEGNTWENVCEKIGYSWRQTHRKHKEILRKLSQDGIEWHTKNVI